MPAAIATAALSSGSTVAPNVRKATMMMNAAMKPMVCGESRSRPSHRRR
jgi:hypothetical protein